MVAYDEQKKYDDDNEEEEEPTQAHLIIFTQNTERLMKRELKMNSRGTKNVNRD